MFDTEKLVNHEKIITLDDKYSVNCGRVFMTGTQALIRVALLQKQRDMEEGLHTAGYISGYRGSPLGGLDIAAEKAKKFLEQNDIRFHPGLNEDLAATSIWGTQQVNLFPDAQYQGVFGMWYGKGPGVDRCGDVFKHANMAGTSPLGGVLVLAGDDHAAKSSTVAHQSEHMFKACGIPVLYPASVQEYLDYGLHGWAMSRYTGLWVAMKCVTDVVESGATVDIDPHKLEIVKPSDFTVPKDGLNIRWPDAVLDQETRLINYKLYAALAYARANKLNQIIWDSPHAKVGIITAGKSYLDTRQALADLGIDEDSARSIGIRLFKVGMTWPLEAEGVREFARGLEEVLVIEEKRQILEYQVKEELYNWNDDVRPRVVGKFDDTGEWSNKEHSGHGSWLLPATYELNPALIARAIAARVEQYFSGHPIAAKVKERVAFLEAKEKAVYTPAGVIAAEQIRTPHFCSGCPHNTSTKVPDGSRALAGIGCHYMVTWMDRNTDTFTHMGGEGATWIGHSPFTKEKHVFANLGDGTYMHSGLLAIRAAVAAKVNITYKVLFNDAVAMTGGQAFDGPLDPAMISRQLAAESVSPIYVVTDDPSKYGDTVEWAAGVRIYHRSHLEEVQLKLRTCVGVSAMIYDQTCAAEKRRRRKRGTYPDPVKRVVINKRVCEGCGDCSTQSNCLSVEPVDTPYGRKRQINQSSCNKDFSCATGFCPSFVTVKNGQLRALLKPVSSDKVDLHERLGALPYPNIQPPHKPYGALVTGIGGTGVITVGQIMAMAAHIEGLACTVLDMSGLAQKGGPVISHIRMCNNQNLLHSTRVGTGGADLVLACDALVAASPSALATMEEGRTHVVLNDAASPTAAFIHDPNWRYPDQSLKETVAAACGPEFVETVNATKIATRFMGDELATNMFMLGYSWQKGWIPLGLNSILKAIEINATAVVFNQTAFKLGRASAVYGDTLSQQINVPEQKTSVVHFVKRESLELIIENFSKELTEYQDKQYAQHYQSFVAAVLQVEDSICVSKQARPLSRAVAINYFKLLAYKDEYEVARLYSDAQFHDEVSHLFETPRKLVFHLAPPLFSKKDIHGHLVKREFGEWILPLFRYLAKAKFLRGTLFDPFGYSAERQKERALIKQYHTRVLEMLPRLAATNHDAAVAIAELPQMIKGYGHIKDAGINIYEEKYSLLAKDFSNKD